MIRILQKGRCVMKLSIPQRDYNMVSEAMRAGKILHREYQDDNVLIDVDLPMQNSYRFEKYKRESG